MKTQILALLISLFTLPAYSAPARMGEWKQGKDGPLNFWIYLPANHGPELSLMLNLHGCTQKAADLKELGNWEAAAERYGMAVVIPDVPNGGVLMGCWDYYETNHTETNRHNGPLIALTEKLLQNSSLNVAPSQVFVSGLSSGAAQAMLLGCLRPDLFHGVGINSGPAIGTGTGDLHQPNTTPREVARFCKQLAGKHAPHFATQKTSIIVGDQDHIVTPQHSAMIAEAMTEIYDLRSKAEFDVSKLKGTNTKGRGLAYFDSQSAPRVTLIVNAGLGHAWPSGKGATGHVNVTMKFINPNSIDYPDYLGRVFTQQMGVRQKMRPRHAGYAL